MSDTLTPYDTGKRAEPKVWPTPTRSELTSTPPIERALIEADYGKVDFENDEGTTVATVWIEGTADGYVVHIDMEDPRIEVHHG